ncbi:MAG: ArsR/SmtB family transcription factor, partial [Longimicrobiales bacterium]
MSECTVPDISAVAAAMGERTRASMLAALLSGEWLTAGELAKRAGVQAPTASEHLARLHAAGLIARRRSGRHVYHALANADVAAALEALARVVTHDVASHATTAPDALRLARTCYDHLAGRLGVALTDALVERGMLAPPNLTLTERGAAWLSSEGIDTDTLRAQRRAFTRPCLDWSERRDHLAGAVGAALAAMMLERRWLARIDGSRAVRLT